MDKNFTIEPLEIWGGIECTYNRVGDFYMDQLERSGYYQRSSDLDRVAGLGIKRLRLPVIWEKHVPFKNAVIDWSFTQGNIDKLTSLGIQPIAGLVHHGSGPAHCSFFDGSFENGLAAFAAAFAEKFPFVEYYTPINEPLTTARFCGLYGHWYPHETNANAFLQILLAECRAVILSMQAIRKINPNAKLIQTDDLGKTHSTALLQPQADFENHRRWLAFDLLCGRVNHEHELYHYLTGCGVTDEQLLFFRENPCRPDVIGINHYLTSERYLDENIDNYPQHSWGGNGVWQYADVEAVRVSKPVVEGPAAIFREAWERYGIPLAITEVHLHCTREEQLRWFQQVYNDAIAIKNEGADVRAITAWAIYGSFDWCSLLTQCNGVYEAGLFDVRSATPRPTALTKIVKHLVNGETFDHPVMSEKGWWQRDCRIIYETNGYPRIATPVNTSTRPIIITGKTGTLGNAFARICHLRGIHYILAGRDDIDIASEASVEAFIKKYNPWALVNTAGFVRVDDAEKEKENCFLINAKVPELLAKSCARHGVKFVTYSSDLVFNGQKGQPYLESDLVSPLNIYGSSKALAERLVTAGNDEALIIRTSAFFGPWDRYNFVHHAINSFKQLQQFAVANDVTVSPTYIPDLVNTTLDLLIDDECGIWNLCNKGEATWAMLAEEIAARTGYSRNAFKAVSISEMGLVAPRPQYSVLTTEKGLELPSLENAINRFFYEQELLQL